MHCLDLHEASAWRFAERAGDVEPVPERLFKGYGGTDSALEQVKHELFFTPKTSASPVVFRKADTPRGKTPLHDE